MSEIEYHISVERLYKYCKGCGLLKNRETDYYRSGISNVQSRCKPCHYELRKKTEIKVPPYVKRPPRIKTNPFHKQPDVIQEAVLQYYNNVPHNQLSRMLDINVHTFNDWRRKGYIVPRPTAV